jgi:very-short-patch-repair endonuclease
MFRRTVNVVSPRMRGFARDLRREQTPYERILWSLLRDRRFAEFKFRRQQPLGPYIADFVCIEAKLIVELDGSQHADDPTDTTRDAELTRRGFRVLRIWNNDLIRNKDGVCEAIYSALNAGGHP